MRRYGQYIIMFLLLLFSIPNAIGQTRNNLIANGKKLILLIDLNSPKTDIDSILKRAGISETDKQAFLKGDVSALKNDGWILIGKDGNLVQYSRPLKDINNNPQLSPYVITGKIIKNNTRHGYLDDADYGINKFSNPSVIELPNGLTRFLLQGHLSARRVFLSGSFNDWSTLKGLMNKTPTGWAIDIKLSPDGYEYKFIADSRWMDDPDNLVNVDDGAGNVNSVYFKYNYTFKLKGFPAVRKVTLAGSFNNWDANELLFEKKGDTWELPLYLHDGTQAYRFMVDGKWITDPANPDKYKDEDGIMTSVIKLGNAVYFTLNGYTKAKNVYIAGNFNNWKPDKIKLQKTIDGWSVPVILPAGNYNYKFIVDEQWVLDPLNQNISVENGQANNFLAVKPNHTFKIKGYGNAKRIILSGSFNNWSTDSYTLAHTGDEWSISMRLKPGKYLYKFIVDGNWMIDPGNPLWEQNQYGTGNSVLWIEP